MATVRSVRPSAFSLGVCRKNLCLDHLDLGLALAQITVAKPDKGVALLMLSLMLCRPCISPGLLSFCSLHSHRMDGAVAELALDTHGGRSVTTLICSYRKKIRINGGSSTRLLPSLIVRIEGERHADVVSVVVLIRIRNRNAQ